MEEPQKVEKFENEKISVELTFLPDCVRTFKIKAFPAFMDEEFKKAIRNVGKDVSLPGFRKGKAPDNVILDNYKGVVEKEWKDSVVRQSINTALDLSKVYPYSREAFRKVDLQKISTEEALIYCEIETSPDVPAIDPKNLHVENIEPTPVSDEELEARIDEVRFRFAKWKDVEGRGVQDGDYVELSLQIVKPEQKDLGEKLLFKFHEMAPWMQKALLGKETGEVMEVWSEKDPAADASVSFTPSLINIKIGKISEAELPPIDAEFLKNCRVDSEEEFRKRTRLQLEADKNRKIFQTRFEALEKTLSDAYPFELPASYVNREQMQAWEKVEIEKLAADTTLSDEEKQAKLADVAEKVKNDIFNKARSELLLDRFFGDEKLETPTDGEVQQAILEHSFVTRDFERFQNDKAYADRKRFFITRDLQHRKAAKKLLEKIDAKKSAAKA